jgi:hypothetical protein
LGLNFKKNMKNKLSLFLLGLLFSAIIPVVAFADCGTAAHLVTVTTSNGTVTDQCACVSGATGTYPDCSCPTGTTWNGSSCNTSYTGGGSQENACNATGNTWNSSTSECECTTSGYGWTGSSCYPCGQYDATTGEDFCGTGCAGYGGCSSGSDTGTGNGTGTGTGTGGTGSGGVIANPTTYNSLADLLEAVMIWIQDIGLAIAPLLIVYGGFTYITAMGDPAKITKAKNILLYAAIGLIVVLLDKSLLGVIQSWIPAS